MLLQKATLCYCTVHTCRKSTEAFHRLHCYTCAVSLCCIVLLYCTHVSQIDQSCASVDKRHDCLCASHPIKPDNISYLTIQFAIATYRCHEHALARTNSRSPARRHGHSYKHTYIHTYALWGLRGLVKWLRSAHCALRTVVIEYNTVHTCSSWTDALCESFGDK